MTQLDMFEVLEVAAAPLGPSFRDCAEMVLDNLLGGTPRGREYKAELLKKSSSQFYWEVAALELKAMGIFVPSNAQACNLPVQKRKPKLNPPAIKPNVGPTLKDMKWIL